MMDKQREVFEAWAVANEMTASGDREDRLDYPLGRCLWKAWQAATAAERERAAQAFEREVDTWDEMRERGYSGAIRRKGAAAIRAG